MPADLAVIIVSTNEARWLSACLLSLFEHLGAITANVIVVDNDSIDGTRELVETEFPQARIVSSQNFGFGHANNEGFATTSSRYVLFLNPDTEILNGTFEQLIADLDDRLDVGLIGVRQLAADGKLFPTIRRFPTFPRYLFEALSSERFPFRASWLGERELDMSIYEHEVACDWTSGSFMLARREALESAGGFDERFFIFSEEVDLCLRIRQAGWEIRHVPTMTILHHFNKVGVSSRIISQDAFARKQYMIKHFRQPKRFACLLTLHLRHIVRSVPIGGDRAHAAARSSAAREALRVLRPSTPPPFGVPPPAAMVDRRRERSSNDDAKLPPANPHRD